MGVPTRGVEARGVDSGFSIDVVDRVIVSVLGLFGVGGISGEVLFSFPISSFTWGAFSATAGGVFLVACTIELKISLAPLVVNVDRSFLHAGSVFLSLGVAETGG